MAHLPVSEETRYHRHAVFSQGTRLVGTDIRCIAHGLTGGKGANKVLVLVHLTRRVGKCDGHSQRQTLRDSHHDDGHGYDKAIKNSFPSFSHVLPLVLRCTECANQHGNECGNSSREAQHANLVRHLLQLLLERSLRLICDQIRLDTSPLGEGTNAYDHRMRLIGLCYQRAGKEENITCLTFAEIVRLTR